MYNECATADRPQAQAVLSIAAGNSISAGLPNYARNRIKAMAVLNELLPDKICAGYFSSPPTTLRFAVGSPASGDARLVHALAQQFVRDRASIRLTPAVSGTASQSIS
jgi:hypothetical protein